MGYQNGTLTCEDGVVGRTSYDSGGLKFEVSCKIWFHEKAAFGVAAVEEQTLWKKDGILIGKSSETLLLTDTGQNAKTKLPENH